jgi:hypothetical protein
MKTPQRPFIVEHKSGRRRSESRPRSIWGDTDLKALVKAAETDAPHLFKPGSTADLPVGGNDAAPDPVVRRPVTTAASVDPPLPLRPQPEPEEMKAEPSAADLPVSPAKVVRKKNVKPIKPRTKKPKAASGASDGEAHSTDDTASLIEAAEFSDELVELSEENRRLKTLLAEHLHRQNGALREMLSRFKR